jgi:hypothetical protein
MKPSLNSTTLLLFTLITLAITSCKKKDEKPVTYPISFYTERIEVVSNTRMFTQEGEIKDPQQIASFTANQDYYFKAENNSFAKDELYATLTSKETASFGESSHIFNVSQSGNQYIYTSEFKSLVAPMVNDSFTNYILKHRSVYTEAPGSGSVIRATRVSYGNHEEMRFPVIAYATSQGIEGQTIYKTGEITPNEFNESVVGKLKANETLAVKTYMVICKATRN